MNAELDLAWNIIANTDTHLFLTGKAGTGKTTFLRRLRQDLPKRMIVVAPTGIAAINAQGVTIHSFFQLPFGPQIPGTQHANNKRYQFRRSKLRLIRSVDLVVIDEISMVRADLLDAIDSVLRTYRDRTRPFGGVQMLMIGDMQQLAPVAKEDEWNLLKSHYVTPYFFSSKALQQSDFVTVELQHVYRQNDEHFLTLLNKVRTNTIDAAALAELNQRYVPDFKSSKEDGYIRLVTHNNQADAINSRELEALQTSPFTFEASVDGEFNEIAYPNDKTLTLKEGAQVMFIKNDSSLAKQFYNGMIGEVVELDSDTIKVKSADSGKIIEVQQETWENIKYDLDERTKEITEKVIGRFTQYPLKTAWAITVHKSQGLTFEHAIIDVQHSFAHGQTYVALSRCKTLEGMVLAAPIPSYAIINDRTVEAFTDDPRHKSPDEQRLDNMQRAFLLRTIADLFSFEHVRYGYEDMIRQMREHFYDLYPTQYKAWLDNAQKFNAEVESMAAKFHVQYNKIVMTEAEYATSALLNERLRKGAAYFEERLCDTYSLLQHTNLPTDNQAVKERIEGIMQNISDVVRFKIQLLHYVAGNGLMLQDYLKQKAKIALQLDDATDNKPSSKSNSDNAPAGFKPRKEKKEKKQRMVIDVPTEARFKELFAILVEWRKKKADEISRPAFAVMTQKVLLGIVNTLPTNNDELDIIPGIGKHFIDSYGEEVLAIVDSAMKQYGYQKPELTFKVANTMTQKDKEARALELYLEGKQVPEIAAEFMVTESTVYNYLIPALKEGKLPLNYLFEQKRIDAVNACIAQNPEASAKELLDILGRDDFDYGIINCCKAVR